MKVLLSLLTRRGERTKGYVYLYMSLYRHMWM